MDQEKIARLVNQLQGIAQSGKEYGKDVFDLERYQQLSEVTAELLSELTTLPDDKIDYYLLNDEGYATPKVDVRAVVFHEDRLLLVKEKSDDSWALPGGWADIGYSPKEIAEKEVFEEAGIKVKAQRLLAVKDKAKHAYPVSLTYVYKLFIVCQPLDVEVQTGIETQAVQFFTADEAEQLKLSLGRTLQEDILMAFSDHRQPLETTCD